MCHSLRALCRKLSERRRPCDDARLHQAGCAVFCPVSPGGPIHDAGKRLYYAALPYLRGCLQSMCRRVWEASARTLPAMRSGLSDLCASVSANGRLTPGQEKPGILLFWNCAFPLLGRPFPVLYLRKILAIFMDILMMCGNFLL